MRISDWSSDVCSSDLVESLLRGRSRELGLERGINQSRELARELTRDLGLGRGLGMSRQGEDMADDRADMGEDYEARALRPPGSEVSLLPSAIEGLTSARRWEARRVGEVSVYTSASRWSPTY